MRRLFSSSAGSSISPTLTQLMILVKEQVERKLIGGKMRDWNVEPSDAIPNASAIVSTKEGGYTFILNPNHKVTKLLEDAVNSNSQIPLALDHDATRMVDQIFASAMVEFECKNDLKLLHHKDRKVFLECVYAKDIEQLAQLLDHPPSSITTMDELMLKCDNMREDVKRRFRENELMGKAVPKVLDYMMEKAKGSPPSDIGQTAVELSYWENIMRMMDEEEQAMIPSDPIIKLSSPKWKLSNEMRLHKPTVRENVKFVDNDEDSE